MKMRGFTLVEIVVASTVIALGLAGLFEGARITYKSLDRLDLLTSSAHLEALLISTLSDTDQIEPLAEDLRSGIVPTEFGLNAEVFDYDSNEYKGLEIARVGEKLFFDKDFNACNEGDPNCLLSTEVGIHCEDKLGHPWCGWAYRIKFEDPNINVPNLGVQHHGPFEPEDFVLPVLFDRFLREDAECPADQILFGMHRYTGEAYCRAVISSNCGPGQIFLGYRISYTQGLSAVCGSLTSEGCPSWGPNTGVWVLQAVTFRPSGSKNWGARDGVCVPLGKPETEHLCVNPSHVNQLVCGRGYYVNMAPPSCTRRYQRTVEVSCSDPDDEGPCYQTQFSSTDGVPSRWNRFVGCGSTGGPPESGWSIMGALYDTSGVKCINHAQ